MSNPKQYNNVWNTIFRSCRGLFYTRWNNSKLVYEHWWKSWSGPKLVRFRASCQSPQIVCKGQWNRAATPEQQGLSSKSWKVSWASNLPLHRVLLRGRPVTFKAPGMHTHAITFFSQRDNDNLRTVDLETDTVETEQEIATVGGTSEELDSINIGNDEELGNIIIMIIWYNYYSLSLLLLWNCEMMMLHLGGNGV